MTLAPPVWGWTAVPDVAEVGADPPRVTKEGRLLRLAPGVHHAVDLVAGDTLLRDGFGGRRLDVTGACRRRDEERAHTAAQPLHGEKRATRTERFVAGVGLCPYAAKKLWVGWAIIES